MKLSEHPLIIELDQFKSEISNKLSLIRDKYGAEIDQIKIISGKEGTDLNFCIDVEILRNNENKQ